MSKMYFLIVFLVISTEIHSQTKMIIQPRLLYWEENNSLNKIKNNSILDSISVKGLLDKCGNFKFKNILYNKSTKNGISLDLHTKNKEITKFISLNAKNIIKFTNSMIFSPMIIDGKQVETEWWFSFELIKDKYE